jgi:hypothetical protein
MKRYGVDTMHPFRLLKRLSPHTNTKVAVAVTITEALGHMRKKAPLGPVECGPRSEPAKKTCRMPETVRVSQGLIDNSVASEHLVTIVGV